MAPVIIGKDLYKCYPGFPPVLRGVNIEVEPGEMVAIMGPSGCGKSTMLHILGMLHAPDSGTLKILDQNVLKFNSQETAAFRRGNMGFVMQASNLFEHSTVFENVEFPLIYENVPPQERWERVIRALDLVRLSSRVHYRSNRLSGGEQQRVAIARAMVNSPRILLADEPTGALDARTSVVIMENFRNLCHKGGVAMVMVTHDPKMADYCDSIYTLEDGVLKCKKHNSPAVAAASSENFLNPPEPIVRGALIGWKFPEKHIPALTEFAERLHGQRLLARIYALSSNKPFSGQAGYSLPLPIRRIGFFQKLLGIRVLLRRAKSSNSLWDLWRRLSPARGSRNLLQRLKSFSCGAIMSRWCIADEIWFLYAAGALKVVDSTWVAANLTRQPFAFDLRAQDMPYLNQDCATRAADAAFITCQTQALANAFKKFAPSIPDEKIIILPNPPRFASTEDEPDSSLPPASDKAVEILCMDPASNPQAFRILFSAYRTLDKKEFHLNILGKASFLLRMRLLSLGFRKRVSFLKSEENISTGFRAAKIFIAWSLHGSGMELAMPWPVSEAMAFGLPIIALSISPGMSILKSGENCVLASDPAHIAAEIKKINANEEVALKLGKSAKEDIRASLNIAGATRKIADRMIEATSQRTQNAI